MPSLATRWRRPSPAGGRPPGAPRPAPARAEVEPAPPVGVAQPDCPRLDSGRDRKLSSHGLQAFDEGARRDSFDGGVELGRRQPFGCEPAPAAVSTLSKMA